MKVLYAIQATGNGHISRAQELIPLLQKNIDLDILVSGTAADIALDYPIKYRFHGLSFVFGKHGGIHLWQTIKGLNIKQFISDVRELSLDEYDIVINDFEPVSAWACLLKKKYAISLSHHASLLYPSVPKPHKKAFFSRLILKYYAPTTKTYGFHFKKYHTDIHLPVIKKQIRFSAPKKLGFYVVYLPAFSEERIIEVLAAFPETKWVVFSKHRKTAYKIKNIHINPIDELRFNKKLIHCNGVICGAGFETPAEALYLRKKLLVVPMKNQYEQLCNAEALKEIGVKVLYEFNPSIVKHLEKWMVVKNKVKVSYSGSGQIVLNQIFIDYIKRRHKTQIQDAFENAIG